MGANLLGSETIYHLSIIFNRSFHTVVKIIVGDFIVGVPPIREFYKHSSWKYSREQEPPRIPVRKVHGVDNGTR